MRNKLTIIIFCLLLFVLILFGCSAGLNGDEITEYGMSEVVISGLAEEEFTVTVSELAALETVNRSATATRSNGQKVSIEAIGPLLDTFLAEYDKSQTDFCRVRFSADDGYSIAVGQDVLAAREIVLAVSDGGQALSSDDQPVRVVIPGERAMYWVRHLSRIEFESGSATVDCNSLVLLETAASTLDSREYEYNGAMDRVVAAADLLAAFGGIRNDGTLVALDAVDGLNKTETEPNFLGMDIKYTGEDAPRLVGNNLPEGMQVFGLVWISYGETRFLSLPQLLSVSGESYVLFSDLLKMAELTSAEQYIIDCADGSYQTLSAADLAEAVVCLDEQGRAVLDLGNNNRIADIMDIEVLQ